MKPFLTRLLLLVFVLISAISTPLLASHSLGGDITYQVVGQNVYKVTVTLYQDCLNGAPLAIAQDYPLFYTLYDLQTHQEYHDSISLSRIGSVNPNTIPGCVGNQPGGCVSYALFEKTLNLPVNHDYIVAYQRCCLSESFRNIPNPGSNGITLFTQISTQQSSIGTNSSPLLQPLQSLGFCINMPFTIDFSATDPDGDTLSYYFVPALTAATGSNPKPFASAPPYYPISYSNLASGAEPLLGNGSLNIDQNSGIITGNVYTTGTYLINVACVEKRNNQIIGTTYRSFGLTVSNCNKEVSAELKQDIVTGLLNNNVLISRCGTNHKVQFTNSSTGAQSYSWNFGDPSTLDNTSSATNPSHTYSAAGLFPLTLIAYGVNCNDTLNGYVSITDDSVIADFNFQGNTCILDSIHFSDNSASTTSVIGAYEWTAEGIRYYGNPVDLSFVHPGRQTVVHTVRSDAGCIASVSKEIDIREADINAGPDTTVVSGTRLEFHPSGGTGYKWSYPNGIIAYPVNTFNYSYGGNVYTFFVTGVDARGCSGNDTINVTVSKDAYVYVPSAFTPNNDGLNDVLHVRQSGYSFIEFRVYNRQGNVVFTSSDARQGWEGTYKGKPAPPDTYLWMAWMKAGGGKTELFKGDVTVIR